MLWVAALAVAAPTAALDAIAADAAAFSAALLTAQTHLLRRAEAEAPALLPRLRDDPPALLPRGFGRLPAILDDLPPAEVPLERHRYAVEALARDFSPDLAAARALATAAATAPLEEAVADYAFRRDRLRFLEAQLAYHRFWQDALEKHRPFFAARSALLPLAEQLDVLARAQSPEAVPLRRALLAKLGAFRPTPGVSCRGGTLGLRVLTDVDDPAFLARVAAAFRDAFATSPAARARRLEGAVELVRFRAPGEPPLGAPVDEERHLARFPPSALVLTTGADRTHARVGRSVHLGPDPTRPRELAHELFHLVGFDDAYLRGVEREDPTHGAVFVEWWGIESGIMGAPAVGRLSDEMTETLAEAYRCGPPRG